MESDVSPGLFTRLFEADPDLLRHVETGQRERLQHFITVPAIRVEPGRWAATVDEANLALGLLVIEGFICGEIELLGRRGVELVGRGDVIRPWQEAEPGSIPHLAEWSVLSPARLAVLEAGSLPELSRIPGVLPELFARAITRVRSLALHAALGRIRGVGSRLLVLLWHLADRWGQRESGQVVLPIPLSHALLADLVSAERPYVSTELKGLRDRGLISRRDDGYWVLHGSPPHEVADLMSVQPVPGDAGSGSGD